MVEGILTLPPATRQYYTSRCPPRRTRTADNTEGGQRPGLAPQCCSLPRSVGRLEARPRVPRFRRSGAAWSWSRSISWHSSRTVGRPIVDLKNARGCGHRDRRGCLTTTRARVIVSCWPGGSRWRHRRVALPAVGSGQRRVRTGSRVKAPRTTCSDSTGIDGEAHTITVASHPRGVEIRARPSFTIPRSRISR
jgi:hypothetical protein